MKPGRSDLKIRKRVKVDLSWRAWSLIVGFFILIGFVGLSFAYGGTSPAIHGHSAGEIEGLGNSGSSVFTRWGRSDCPSGSDKVYDGYVAGAHYTHGGTSSTLCLTKTPTWLNYSDANNNGALLYGTEFETVTYSGVSDFKTLQEYKASCAVCTINKSNVFMYPGSKECPSGWSTVYYGYLMADFYTQGKNEMVCVDVNPLGIGSATSYDGNLWYTTEAECGALNCTAGGYVQDRELTCSVCAK